MNIEIDEWMNEYKNKLYTDGDIKKNLSCLWSNLQVSMDDREEPKKGLFEIGASTAWIFLTNKLTQINLITYFMCFFLLSICVWRRLTRFVIRLQDRKTKQSKPQTILYIVQTQNTRFLLWLIYEYKITFGACVTNH